MKKLAILSPLVILMASTSLAQDSCITHPSCADLGYTKSASQCSGKTTLKCPFDLTKVSCEDESKNSTIPLWDWANSKSCDGTTNWIKDSTSGEWRYSVPQNGCVLLLTNNSSHTTGLANTFSILDTSNNTITTYSNRPHVICLEKNYTIASTNFISLLTGWCLFVPYKIQSSSETQPDTPETNTPSTPQCNVGDIYYDDDTCSSTLDVTKNAIGIVFDSTRRYIVSLTEGQLNGDWWVGYSLPTDLTIPQIAFTSTDLIKDFNGKAYTEELSSLTTYRHFAAAICADSTIGNKSWFLPSGGQMYILGQQAETINTTIRNMNFNAYTTLDYFRTWQSDSYNYNPSLDCNIMLTDNQTILYWTSNRSSNSSQSAIAYSFSPNNGGFSQTKHNSPGYVGEPSNCGGDSGMVTVSSKYYATRCIAEY